MVILDLRDSKHGFPCKVEDDPLIKLVLPPIEDGEYQYAEERRLFYVALTRARKGVYLVVDERQPSPFARELLDIPGQEIRLINKLIPPVPAVHGRKPERVQKPGEPALLKSPGLPVLIACLPELQGRIRQH